MSQGEDRTQSALTATRILLATVNATPGRPSALAFPSSSPSSMLRVRACMASAVFKVFLQQRVHSCASDEKYQRASAHLSALRDARSSLHLGAVDDGKKSETRGQEHDRHPRDVLDGTRTPAVSMHPPSPTRLFPFPVPRPDRRPRSGVNPFRLLTPRHPP